MSHNAAAEVATPRRSQAARRTPAPGPAARHGRRRRRRLPGSPPAPVARTRTAPSMRVAALISGGKDSCYNMMQCIAAGHQIVALANLRPAENQVGSDELDSYMYQTVGHHAVDLYAEAMALPLYRRTIRGRSVDTGRVYTEREGDEVEDLYELLKLVKGIARVTLPAEYDALNLQDFHMNLEVGSQAIVYRTPNELCTHSKFDKHTFPPFISEIAECEV
nr:diphthine--ammonia ligase isoform X2 [Panthera onca]